MLDEELLRYKSSRAGAAALGCTHATKPKRQCNTCNYIIFRHNQKPSTPPQCTAVSCGSILAYSATACCCAARLLTVVCVQAQCHLLLCKTSRGSFSYKSHHYNQVACKVAAAHLEGCS